jgi:hypothetical protein
VCVRIDIVPRYVHVGSDEVAGGPGKSFDSDEILYGHTPKCHQELRVTSMYFPLDGKSLLGNT